MLHAISKGKKTGRANNGAPCLRWYMCGYCRYMCDEKPFFSLCQNGRVTFAF